MADAEPPELLAQTVYATEFSCNTVGVPLMVPVAESKDNPDGKSGSTSQVVTPPPEVVGVIGDIPVSFSNVIVCGL